MAIRLTIVALLSVLFVQSAFASFAHEKEMKKIDEYWDKEFVNPANYKAVGDNKFARLTPAFWNSLTKNPVSLKYFTVCAAYQFMVDHFKENEAAFEKKFGKMDKEKRTKIRGTLADSAYNLNDEARKKMIEAPGTLNNFFKLKLESLLEKKSL
ncbi:MAG: hypothetical protein K2P81_10615 [Bacteriovoracaceae bacterium]|nr:hypothetical protein [Bacteriovoracaceae bacterium]